jgi:hypothetical protein
MTKLTFTLTFVVISLLSTGQNKSKYSFNKTESIDSTSIVIVSTYNSPVKFSFNYNSSLLFVDTKYNKTYKLNLTPPFRVTDYKANNPGKFLGEKYVVFRAKTSNIDNNTKLNWRDPDYLFICDTHGQSVRKISPDNFDVISWTFNRVTNTITFVGTGDTDKNGKFDDKDKDKIYVFDLTSTSTSEVYNSDDQNK